MCYVGTLSHPFYSVSESELQTVVSEVVAQMLREVCTSEITAEKERIAEEKRKLEEERSVYCLSFSLFLNYTFEFLMELNL